MIVTWFKFIHVGAIAFWSAGLIALPFLYSQRRALEGDALYRLHAFTRSLYINIVSPAAFVAIGSGTVLILMQGTYENWFSAKLVGVAVMTGIHIFSGLMILRVFEPGNRYSLGRAAVVVTLTSTVVSAILVLVLGKPDLRWPGALDTFFAPGALRTMFTQVTGVAI